MDFRLLLVHGSSLNAHSVWEHMSFTGQVFHPTAGCPTPRRPRPGDWGKLGNANWEMGSSEEGPKLSFKPIPVLSVVQAAI